MKRITLFLACLLMTASQLFAQATKVTGTVINAEDGEPIPGATVVIEGTKTGVLTNADGQFTITPPTTAKRLVISCAGMVAQTVRIRPTLSIRLEADSKALNEVMVVAYGTATRSSFTGSAAVVGADVIANKVATNVTASLAGTTPGVQYMSPSGDPADNGATLRIRGIGSINASNTPLYVVDGVPFDAPISTINPQDVESMTVLKDASASAIYGARGANGVILITTKKGNKNQKSEIRFDAKWGSNSRLVPNYDVISNPGQYYEEVFKRLYNTNITSGYDAAYAYQNANSRLYDAGNGGVGYQIYTLPEGQNLIGTNMKLNPNAKMGYSDGEYYYTADNWYDETFHSSFRQEYNFSTRGGTDRLNVYAGGGYLQDGGMIDNSGFKRYNGRMNMDFQANDWIRLSANMNYTHTDSDQPYSTTNWASSGNLFYVTNTIAPIYPLYVRNADGTIKTEAGRIVYDSNQTNFQRSSLTGNAVRDNAYDKKKTYRDVFSGNWGLSINPIKGLSISGNLGVMSNNLRRNYLYSVFGSAASVDGRAATLHTRTFTVNSRMMAEYKTDFGGTLHNLNALVGYEQYKKKYQYFDASNSHLYNPYVGELGNAKSTSDREMDSYTENYMTEGVLSRLQYDYAGKYFVSASYRRDASSRFAPGHRWGNFGSLGLGWIMNKEDFLKDVSWIDMLKFKASYGVQGNDDLVKGEYPFSDLYSTSYNETTGDYSNALIQKGNEELTWETSHAINTGFDFNLFKGRLNGTVEYFVRKTTDMLFEKDFPLSSGYPYGVTLPINAGSMINHGIELSVEGVAISTKDFEWRLNANLTHYKNKILRLVDIYRESGMKFSSSIYKEGGSIYQAYMLKYAGVDEKGSARYYKDNADGTIGTTTDATAATKYDCGSYLPKLYGGFGTSLRYKGLDLSATFSYQLGGKIYDGQYQNLMWTQTNTGNNIHKDVLKSWSTTNTSAELPRWDATGWGNLAQTATDYFITSSNYLCLSNLMLGYNLPKQVLNKIRVNNLRVYVAGDNLFLLTARKGLDPRITTGTGSMTAGSGRMSSGNYAAMRTITAGVTLNF